MSVAGAGDAIRREVSGWPGVEAQPHRFGGLEYHVGRRELGHVHGDAQLDAPFPRAVRDELVASGRAEPHHILPESGWITLRFREAADVERAIGLLRANYERATHAGSPQP